MNEMTEQGEYLPNEELLKKMIATEIPLPDVSSEIKSSQSKIPLSNLTALGVGFEPIASMVQQITSGGKAVSGLYKVTIPAGTHLATFNDGTGWLGAAFGNAGEGIVAQARLNPLISNPAMLFAAAALMQINQKLDRIEANQKEMMDFIVRKEKSELRGDLEYLTKTFNNYKYNWNNEKYKDSNSKEVLNIRRKAGASVNFYRTQIIDHAGKSNLLHSDKDVEKQVMKVQDEFEDYQLSLYIYSFSYFMEVILQENFNSEYLKSITSEIEALSKQYMELFTNAYTKIKERTKSSVQSKMLDGLSGVSRLAGKAIAKIPIISKGQIDETLIEFGEKVNDYRTIRNEEAMHLLGDSTSNCVRPFVEQIEEMDRLYNNELTLIFDRDNLYLSSGSSNS